jgi:hypothetical protein
MRIHARSVQIEIQFVLDFCHRNDTRSNTIRACHDLIHGLISFMQDSIVIKKSPICTTHCVDMGAPFCKNFTHGFCASPACTFQCALLVKGTRPLFVCRLWHLWSWPIQKFCLPSKHWSLSLFHWACKFKLVLQGARSLLPYFTLVWTAVELALSYRRDWRALGSALCITHFCNIMHVFGILATSSAAWLPCSWMIFRPSQQQNQEWVFL